MKVPSSREKRKRAAQKRNKPYIVTALLFVGLASLSSFLPTVYGAFSHAGGRLLMLLLMLLLLVILAVFTLRYLFGRLHDERPERGELILTWIVLAAEIVVTVVLSAILSALMTGTFHVPVSEDTAIGTENLTGSILNALMFPLLVCAPMAALSARTFGNGYWRTFGVLIKRCYLWTLLCTLVSFGTSLLFTSAFEGFFGTIMAAVLTALLLTFGAEICIEKNPGIEQ